MNHFQLGKRVPSNYVRRPTAQQQQQPRLPLRLGGRFLSTIQQRQQQQQQQQLNSAALFTSPKRRPLLSPLHLKGTASLLKPQYRFLAPCLGATLTSCSPFVGNLMRLGDIMSPFEQFDYDCDDDGIANTTSNIIQPASNLASLLYFQMIREVPPFLSRTKSMPAAYLQPGIIGTLLGLSTTPFFTNDVENENETKTQAIRNILRKEHGIKSNYIHNDQWTGVSLKRWMDLLVRPKQQRQYDDNDDPLVIAIWLAALLEMSKSKADFLDFWIAYDKCVNDYGNTTTSRSSIFATDEYTQAILNDMGSQNEWIQQKFDPIKDLNSDNVNRCMDRLLLSSNQPGCDSLEYSLSLEVVCASMVMQHHPLNSKPVIPNGYYGYDGGDVKADCTEVVVREILDLLLWDEQTSSFDLEHLPKTASKELFQFYYKQQQSLMTTDAPSSGASEAKQQRHAGYDDSLSGKDWFNLLSNLPGCVYLATSPNGKPFELAPTMTNVCRVIRHLVFGDNDVIDGDKDNEDDVSSSFNKLLTELLQRSGEKFHIWSDTLTHSSLYTGKLIKHEIATLQTDSYAIELRMRCDLLDKSGMAVVSHLRQRRQVEIIHAKRFADTLRDHTTRKHNFDPALYILSVGLLADDSTLMTPAAEGMKNDMEFAQIISSKGIIADLLSTPFGCDRRGLRPIVKEEDSNEVEESVARKFQDQSNSSMMTVVQEICDISKVDPDLAVPLLCWILSESPKVYDQLPATAMHGDENWEDSIYERILSLPQEVLERRALHECLRQSWLSNGDVLAILIQWNLGLCSLMEAFLSFDNKSIKLPTFVRFVLMLRS